MRLFSTFFFLNVMNSLIRKQISESGHFNVRHEYANVTISKLVADVEFK